MPAQSYGRENLELGGVESVNVGHLACKNAANANLPPADDVGKVVPNGAGWRLMLH